MEQGWFGFRIQEMQEGLQSVILSEAKDLESRSTLSRFFASLRMTNC